ncbi:hypothetical protein HK405_015138, partial [Cladochytrium tenue]
ATLLSEDLYPKALEYFLGLDEDEEDEDDDEDEGDDDDEGDNEMEPRPRRRKQACLDINAVGESGNATDGLAVDDATRERMAAIFDKLKKVDDEEQEEAQKLAEKFEEKRRNMLEDRDKQVADIPAFWLRALQRLPAGRKSVGQAEAPVLQHWRALRVRRTPKEQQPKLELEFEFTPNPFFDGPPTFTK